MDRQIIGAERPVNWVVHIRAKYTHVFLFRSVEWVCKGGGGKKERVLGFYSSVKPRERERDTKRGAGTRKERREKARKAITII